MEDSALSITDIFIFSNIFTLLSNKVIMIDEGLKLALETFENQFSTFIKTLESGIKRNEEAENSVPLAKKKFDYDLAGLELAIKNFWRYISHDRLVIDLLIKLREKLGELDVIPSSLGNGDSVFRSKPLRDRLNGKIPAMKELLGQIHTTVVRSAS